MSQPRLPSAPHSIQKGSSLGDLLDQEAVECLAYDISLVQPDFDGKGFRRQALKGLKLLSILHRGHHLTRRFSVELSIRPFLICWPERTLAQL